MSEPEKKVVCLGMPAYGEITTGAAMGFYRSSRRQNYDLRLLSHNSSLLAQNMNCLWTWALNIAHKERVDYFAMMHADIEPREFWLDTLIDELEAKRLDVLGVVAPIKDQRGVTSIAMAKADLDPWRIAGRLTMKEIYRLPETFTSEDIGAPLLLNTGLWVCKFNEDWCRQVHFTVNDRICFDQKKNEYFAQCEPEDWFISRLFHELNLKIGATRKVELGHRGTMSFGNTEPWGNNEFDREYFERSPLDKLGPADWFPHSVAGWLTEDEGKKLAQLAAGKIVLEIGSFCGRSTICLAQTAKSVGAVDTFDGRGTALQGNTLELFKRNLRRHFVEKKVNILQGESADILENLPPVFDLIFIDGSHDINSVRRDIELAEPLLRTPESLLVFHDYQSADQGVTDAVDELIASGAELIERYGTLAVVKPAMAMAAAA